MKQAVIIIDLIEDIVGKKGKSNASRAQVVERNIIQKANQVAQFARQHNIPVIWIKVGFADDYHDIPTHSPMFNAAKANQALKLSEHGCDWVEGLDVKRDDIIFIKKAVGAFAGNHLHDWLQSHHIEHLVLGGVSSTMTIESTARLAHDFNYQVTILDDLCAAATFDMHQSSMRALDRMTHITTIAEWLDNKS